MYMYDGMLYFIKEMKEFWLFEIFCFQSNKSITEGKPIEKNYCDAVVNFLLRIACQVWLVSVSN